MIGTEVRTLSQAQPAERGGAPRLTVRNLELPAGRPVRHRRSRTSRSRSARGEIFGIAGVAGNGQNELFQALSGERLVASRRHGPDRRARRSAASAPARGARLGLCCVPEERNGHGAVPDMSLVENAVLSGRQRMGLAAERLHPQPGGARASPRRSSASSTSGRRAPRPPRARCPAAICRSSSSAARSCRTRACWWSRSRPGGSTPAPRPRSTRRCSTSPAPALRSW